MRKVTSVVRQVLNHCERRRTKRNTAYMGAQLRLNCPLCPACDTHNSRWVLGVESGTRDKTCDADPGRIAVETFSAISLLPGLGTEYILNTLKMLLF